MLMLSPLYNFDNKEEVYVYIEKYNKQSNYILFDFIDSNEFIFFNLLINLNYDWEKKPIMFELMNYKQKRVQEGATYRIRIKTLSILQSRIQIIEDSLVIGFRIELEDDDPEIFGKPKSFTFEERFWRNMDDSTNSTLSDLNLNIKTINKLIIRNIGHGNWNELLSNKKFEIVFDCGTIYTTKRVDIIRMIGNRDIDYQKSSPLLILSHWDVDHYHFLLGFDDKTIESFSYFIYRGSIPNLTARKALGRFRLLNNKALIPIATVLPSAPKKSSKELLNLDLTGKGDILIQNAYKNRSRNKSGIGLTIRKKNTCAILSGDYDYSQISNYILPVINYKCDHYLIVPHHGGKAGKFVYSNSTQNLLKEAVISVGKNPYHPPHPHKNNINDLKAKGFSVVRTDNLTNDYYIKL